MSSYSVVHVIVEGQTEKRFINDVLTPYLAEKNVFITPTELSKPGQKGGDVRFVRMMNDLGKFLKQRKDTYVSLFVDYYGIDPDWPGISEAKNYSSPLQIAEHVNQSTQAQVNQKLRDYHPQKRFIPNIIVHEFEALLFSNAEILAKHLDAQPESITTILKECGDEPEFINNSPQTAPSKRLAGLCPRYKKTTTGIDIARSIGIETIREKCPVFNQWLVKLEGLEGVSNG